MSGDEKKEEHATSIKESFSKLFFVITYFLFLYVFKGKIIQVHFKKKKKRKNNEIHIKRSTCFKINA